MGKIILSAFADEADKNISGQIEALKRNNIEYLEIRGVDGENISVISDEKIVEVKKKLDDGGIKVWSIGSPIGKAPITEDFSIQTELFKRVLETATKFDAKCIRLFSFHGTKGEPEFKDEVLLRLSRFVEIAKGSGVVLCHENEKGIYGDVASRCYEIHSSIPELKAVFDPANFVQCGQDTLEAWEMLKPYVYYGHIKDAAEDKRIVPPGTGIGNLRAYIPELSEITTGVLTLEPHLSKFVGLSALEGEDDKSEVGGLNFANNNESFDFAVKCLKSIITEVGLTY